VAYEQQAAVGAGRGKRIQRRFRIEATGERRMGAQPSALLLTPLLGGQLSRLARARLGAEQHLIEVRLEPCQRQAGRPRLIFASHGQPPLSI
jgi:hypothetical protein